jgi:hypothetical protein
MREKKKKEEKEGKKDERERGTEREERRQGRDYAPTMYCAKTAQFRAAQTTFRLSPNRNTRLQHFSSNAFGEHCSK